MQHPTVYSSIKIDGLDVFYREAGPPEAPAVVLLHGLPSSSRMFEPLLQRLADAYRLIAPDYPGFGHSEWPAPSRFAYTFDHYADVLGKFVQTVVQSRYVLYVQDYGGPVGFRLAMKQPEQIAGLIVQNAVAHNTGLSHSWDLRRAFWANRAANEAALRADLLSLASTTRRHIGSDPQPQRYDPDMWTDEFRFLMQPGQAEIQTELFFDYRTNVQSYPQWQRWLQARRPRLLVLWGKYDLSFDLSEPEAYRQDVPDAEVHLLDGGHFALDTAAEEIASLMRSFLGRIWGQTRTGAALGSAT
jgi:pimeloyl-ACP methyl ester carboxylesterase